MSVCSTYGTMDSEMRKTLIGLFVVAELAYAKWISYTLRSDLATHPLDPSLKSCLLLCLWEKDYLKNYNYNNPYSDRILKSSPDIMSIMFHLTDMILQLIIKLM